MSGCDYSIYSRYIESILKNEQKFLVFKQNPLYTEILEHVSFSQGEYYLREIEKSFSLTVDEIKLFCDKNDKIGTPKRHTYERNIVCSPTSLRYIYHSLTILRHMNQLGLDNVTIVEVGCGYGGLLLALEHFSKKMNISIQKYYCIDLTSALKLQAKYLSYHSLSYPVLYQDAKTFGKEIPTSDVFFISNYCFSEISTEAREGYRKHLLPKCPHGFLAWNMIPLYDFGKEVTTVPEDHMGDKNHRLVFF